MRASPFVRWCLVGAAVATFNLLSSPAAAQNDQRAQDLMADAMDQDYLATNFKAAEAKLQTALRVCGDGKCKPAVIARLHRALGVIYAGGTRQPEKAVVAFQEMLRLVPNMVLDPNFTSDDIKKAYDKAKETSGPSPVVVDRAVKVLKEKPWAEQVVFKPIPIFVELPEDTEASKVVARYKAPGDTSWKEIALQKRGTGWGGYIPCAAVEKAGEVSYFTTAFDSNLDRVASGGSASEPRKVKLKESIDGRQPALPDSTPPSSCPREIEPSGLSCESDDDCPGAQVCRNLYCVGEAGELAKEPASKVKKNWLSITFSPDLTYLSTSDDACSVEAQQEGSQGCFFGNGEQFDLPLVEGAGGNSVSSGVAPGSMRILVGFDRLLAGRFLAGVRAGAAFNGHPEMTVSDTKFQILHLEARFTGHLRETGFEGTGVRPYGYVNGGLGETAGLVSTEVSYDDGAQNEQTLNLDVYQRGGPFFAGVGLGVQYAPEVNYGLNLELNIKRTFPDGATVIAPSLGFALGL